MFQTEKISANTKKIREMSEDKLLKRVYQQAGNAIVDFSMIEDGDRIMVAVSGGKDSWVLLDVLEHFRKRAPVKFSLVAANIDQGYAGYRVDQIEDYLQAHKFEYKMEFYDIASIIEEKAANSTPCSLCSRLRRGSLYGLAEKLNCNKIALGHHLDDLAETLLLNQFFVGRTSAMAPKLQSDDGKNVVIRPLSYVQEEEIRQYAKFKAFPIVCCQCPLMCGEVVHGDFKRRMIKNLLTDLELKIPDIKMSLLTAMQNIKPTHMFDKNLQEIYQNAKASMVVDA